ncbi:hypothetical protein V8C86DRAFT_2898440, partial [Haematococcus lacustris]
MQLLHMCCHSWHLAAVSLAFGKAGADWVGAKLDSLLVARGWVITDGCRVGGNVDCNTVGGRWVIDESCCGEGGRPLHPRICMPGWQLGARLACHDGQQHGPSNRAAGQLLPCPVELLADPLQLLCGHTPQAHALLRRLPLGGVGLRRGCVATPMAQRAQQHLSAALHCLTIRPLRPVPLPQRGCTLCQRLCHQG